VAAGRSSGAFVGGALNAMTAHESSLSVTILIPTRDRAESFLRQAIDSVLAQDHPDLELLVIDDGSSDDTPQLLDDYAERYPDRFRFERQANAGQVATLNRGFELARGAVLGYLSDDDVLLPGAVSKLAAALESHPEAVAAYPAYEVVDHGGAVVDTITPREYSVAESLRFHDIIVSVGALFRRDVLDRVGAWDPTLRYCADFDFWLRVGLAGQLVRVAEPLARYREHDRTLTSAERSPLMAREQVDLLDRIYARDDLPADVIAVREQAYHSAYCVAAIVAGPGEDGPGRFFIVDSRAREISSLAASRDLHETIAALRAQAARLQQKLAVRNDELRALRARPAGRRGARARLREWRRR
jgi:hypothetical protein